MERLNVDNILRQSLSSLNIINWIDFNSWMQDYNDANILDFKKQIEEYHRKLDEGEILEWAGKNDAAAAA